MVMKQERLSELNAERAAKKLAAHQAAEEKLKEAAMPPRMQLAAQVSDVHVQLFLIGMLVCTHATTAVAC